MIRIGLAESDTLNRLWHWHEQSRNTTVILGEPLKEPPPAPPPPPLDNANGSMLAGIYREMDDDWNVRGSRALTARRVLRTYELAPATPWYVWLSVALAFILFMAWMLSPAR
jgi:hypothetical protein